MVTYYEERVPYHVPISCALLPPLCLICCLLSASPSYLSSQNLREEVWRKEGGGMPPVSLPSSRGGGEEVTFITTRGSRRKEARRGNGACADSMSIVEYISTSQCVFPTCSVSSHPYPPCPLHVCVCQCPCPGSQVTDLGGREVPSILPSVLCAQDLCCSLVTHVPSAVGDETAC